MRSLLILHSIQFAPGPRVSCEHYIIKFQKKVSKNTEKKRRKYGKYNIISGAFRIEPRVFGTFSDPASAQESSHLQTKMYLLIALMQRHTYKFGKDTKAVSIHMIFTILPYQQVKYSCDAMRLLKTSLYRKTDWGVEARYMWTPQIHFLNWLISMSLPFMRVIGKITMLLE